MKINRLHIILILFFIISDAFCDDEYDAHKHVLKLYNDKRVVRTNDEGLKELRHAWDKDTFVLIDGIHIDKTELNRALDYISFVNKLQLIKCRNLSILNTRTFYPEKETIITTRNGMPYKAKEIKSGLFDYIWEVNACEKRQLFRVVNEKGREEITVYHIKLKE